MGATFGPATASRVLREIALAVLIVGAALVPSAAIASNQSGPCDSDRPAVARAREFLNSHEEHSAYSGTEWLTFAFAHLEKIESLRGATCKGLSAEPGGFRLTYDFDLGPLSRASSMDLHFNQNGDPITVNADAGAFTEMSKLLAKGKEAAIEELKKKANQSNSTDDYWFLVGLRAFTEVFVQADAQECVQLMLRAMNELTTHPADATLAKQNKFVANIPIQVVLVGGREAMELQLGHRADFSAAFKALDWHSPESAANSGNTRLFPSGTTVTPVLDIVETKLPRFRSATGQALDQKTVFTHVVKGELTEEVPVPYSFNDAHSGDSCVLVRLEDGTFGLVMAGAIEDHRILEAFQPVTPPVPLTPQERQFTGTVDAFTTAFPRFVGRAATAAGLDPRQYTKETAYIISVIQACAARASGSSAGGMLTGRHDLCHFVGLLSASDQVKTWNKSTERGIAFAVSPIRGSAEGKQALAIEAVFSSLPSDAPIRGENPFQSAFNAYGIVNGKVLVDRSDARYALAPMPQFVTRPMMGAEFHGTSDAFAAAFPGFVESAVRGGGPQNYNEQAEVAFIIQAVRRCAQITPRVAAKVAGDLSRIGKGEYGMCSGRGEEYSISDTVSSIQGGNWSQDRDWGMQISFRAPHGGWTSPGPFGVRVWFKPPRGAGSAAVYVTSATIERPE